MDEQLELFEARVTKTSQRKRLRQSIPPEVQQEVIRVLAQMGTAALQAARDAKANGRKESDDES